MRNKCYSSFSLGFTGYKEASKPASPAQVLVEPPPYHRCLHFLGTRFYVMGAQMLEVSVLGVGMVLRLGRDS